MAWSAYLLLGCSAALFGQGTRSDYQRAELLAEQTRNRVFKHVLRPVWLKGRPVFWYRIQTGADAHRFIVVDTVAGTRSEAFDHVRLAAALTRELGMAVDPDRLPFTAIVHDDSMSQIQFRIGSQGWQCDLSTYELTRRESPLDEHTTVDRLERPRRSRNRGGDTSIRFVNRLPESLELVWLDASSVPVSYGILEAGSEREQHTFAGHVWLLRTLAGRTMAIFGATEIPGTAVVDQDTPAPTDRDDAAGDNRIDQRPGHRSPDDRWMLEIREHNLWRMDPQTGAASQLSHDGTAVDPYQGPFVWSPDSRRVVVIQERQPEPRHVHLIESSPSDQLQPRLHELLYTKPGDEIPQARPRLFDVESARAIPLAEDLFANPWSISEVRWQPDGRRFSFLYNERGHQVLRIVVVDATTGEAATLLEERSPTFVDYAHKQYSHYLEGTQELIWMSERSGWNHLYRFDLRTGQLLNPLTQGNWVVRRVDRMDADCRQVWFYASGIFPEQDPYYLHYCRASLDGGPLVVLTAGNGTHEVETSPDGEFLIDRYSRVDLPPVTELRRASDGMLVCELETADATALQAIGWRAPIRFSAKGRDGTTPIYGVIYLPRDYDEAQKYPVIEAIYAGPQGSFVPKSFSSYYSQQSLAELGFIVVQIDGMGTSNRSKAFHDVCWQNLGDSGFPDRIVWLQAAAREYPAMDLTRVGLYGGSAGGQSTVRGLLAHPDFYRVGVADCGCHDNRLDKIWWNELWMGWPIGAHYHEQSNVTQAHRLQGKLLLTVGELDRNVDPASTLQLVNALIKADKDFDFIVFPGADHGAGESSYGRRRRNDFFVRHLLGVEPRRAP